MRLLLPAALPIALCVALLSACSMPSPPVSGGTLAEATLVQQGEKSYLQATLTLGTLKEISELLQNGEPVVASYRFRLVRPRQWMPDQTVGELAFVRRLKLHLITRRFEMQDPTAGQTIYTADAETALRFVGNPRYIPFVPDLPLEKNGRYQLQTWFRLDQEGVSQMFRTLHRLLTFWRPDHQFRQNEFRAA